MEFTEIFLLFIHHHQFFNISRCNLNQKYIQTVFSKRMYFNLSPVTIKLYTTLGSYTCCSTYENNAFLCWIQGLIGWSIFKARIFSGHVPIFGLYYFQDPTVWNYLKSMVSKSQNRSEMVTMNQSMATKMSLTVQLNGKLIYPSMQTSSWDFSSGHKTVHDYYYFNHNALVKCESTHWSYNIFIERA